MRWSPRRRLGRRGIAGRQVVAGAAAVAVLAACTGADAAPRPVSPGGPSVISGRAPASAVDELLVRRADAVVSGDIEAFRDTVADPEDTDGRRQLAAFASASALGVARFAHEPVSSATDATDLVVRVAYRVREVDRADRATQVHYRLEYVAGGWRVAAEAPAEGARAAPWLAMPGFSLHRTGRVVVAGTAAAADLVEQADLAADALSDLARWWPGTPRRTLVLAPAKVDEAAALLGVPTSSGSVAATTEGPTGADRIATGDRVVIHPDAWARLGPSGRAVVLAHEAAHVAVRASVPVTAPAWLAEGYADQVGYRRADLPHHRLRAPLTRAVRDGTAPAGLPATIDFDPARGDIRVAYLAAWQAVELLAEEKGDAVVRRLVVACSPPGSVAEAEAACDAALETVTGWSRAELTSAWQHRLSAAARAP
ncbi:MAG: hypothetical protein ACRCSN_19265 [Dermatophilaceae bacterium]